jgi:hypothetical protein
MNPATKEKSRRIIIDRLVQRAKREAMLTTDNRQLATGNCI